jgi:hypothetical protein
MPSPSAVVRFCHLEIKTRRTRRNDHFLAHPVALLLGGVHCTLPPVASGDAKQQGREKDRVALPERVDLVKRLLAQFWVYVLRGNRLGFLKCGLVCCVGLRCAGGCRGLRCEVFAPFFSLRLHPYPSLREYACECCGRRSGRLGLARTLPLRPSRAHVAVSIRATPGSQGRVQGPPQTGLVPRGPLLHGGEEGPMQPPPFRSPSLVFPKVSRRTPAVESDGRFSFTHS